jgi:hypothetical protein
MHAKPGLRSRIAALGTIAGLALGISAAGASAPAHAASAGTAVSAAPDTIRYASVKKCTDEKKGVDVPCGTWRLTLRSGRTVRLPGARVSPRDAKGKVRENQVAPIAVSGDGTTVAYFRKSDDRLVVRRLGGEPLVLRYAPPKGVGMDLIVVYLSPDGGRLAVQVDDEPGRRPTLVFDLSDLSDGPGELPGSLAFHGFSGDGESLLTARLDGDRVTRLITVPAEGEGHSVAPPGAVADNPPYALAADGRAVAFLSGSGRPRLRRYDMESGATASGPSVRLRDEENVEAVTWTGDTQVTAHVSRPVEGDRTAVRVLEIDIGSGRAAVRDSYTIGGNVYGYAVRGA